MYPCNRGMKSNKPIRSCYDSSKSQARTYSPKVVCPAYDSGQDDYDDYDDYNKDYECPQSSDRDSPFEDDSGYYDTKVHSIYDRKGKVIRNFPKKNTKDVSRNNVYDYHYNREIPSPFNRDDDFNIGVSGEDRYYTGNVSDYSVVDDDIDPELIPCNDFYDLGSTSSKETIIRATDHRKKQNRVCTNMGEMTGDSQAYRVSEVKIPITRSDTKTGKTRKGERPCKRPKPKSIMKRFDEAVSFRLKKLTEDTQEKYSTSNDACALQGGRRSVTTEASLSTIGLARSLDPDYKTGALVDATDKLAQAEAACRYDGAIKAAKAAAAGISEGLKAEEAAVAGVRGYQAELTDCINEQLVGMKPIEILGYTGITKPRF